MVVNIHALLWLSLFQGEGGGDSVGGGEKCLLWPFLSPQVRVVAPPWKLIETYTACGRKKMFFTLLFNLHGTPAHSYNDIGLHVTDTTGVWGNATMVMTGRNEKELNWALLAWGPKSAFIRRCWKSTAFTLVNKNDALVGMKPPWNRVCVVGNT